jgi:hypothetical protein
MIVPQRRSAESPHYGISCVTLPLRRMVFKPLHDIRDLHHLRIAEIVTG